MVLKNTTKYTKDMQAGTLWSFFTHAPSRINVLMIKSDLVVLLWLMSNPTVKELTALKVLLSFINKLFMKNLECAKPLNLIGTTPLNDMMQG